MRLDADTTPVPVPPRVVEDAPKAFRFEAPARCPTCRSTTEQWDRDLNAPGMLYD